MPYYSSQRGAGLRNTLAAIRNRDPFKSSGALSATERDGTGLIWESGQLPAAARDQYRTERPTYVVYSYDTPVAWWSAEHGWTVPDVKYSRTTSRHQSVTRRAVDNLY